jgi:serine phosphatase RsbU (regulator of sigma subunit)
MTRAKKTFDQARDFVREHTQGVAVEDFRRLYDRDAPAAFEVLARDHRGDEPKDEFDRFLFRIKIFFQGLSSKLSPARRILFFLGLALLAWGVLDAFGVSRQGVRATPQLSLVAAVLIFFFLFTMELVSRVLVRDELEVAKALQQGLLPSRSPELEEYRFAHSYRTANEVGGDYYDFLPLPDDRLALVVGDASGHGMAAGLLMAIANATLKTALDLDPEPGKALAVLNRTLARTGDNRAFMTLFYAILEPATGRLHYVCAGHPFPFLRRSDGRIEELGTGALPLGIRPELNARGDSTTLEPGDLLVLYSDGLVEAVNKQGDDFGFERLRNLLTADASPQAIHDRVLADFDSFVGDEDVHDDLTLVVIRREDDAPAPPPPPTP